MRKLYLSLLTIALMLASQMVKAAVQTETLIANLDNVAANFENYGIFHYWNFKNMSRDGGEAGTWELASDQVDGMYPVQTVGFENFYVQNGRSDVAGQPDLRFRDANYGLYNFGSGGRTLRMLDMKKGMIVVLNGYPNGTYDYFSGGAINTAIAKEITDSIHALQTSVEVEEGEEAPVADAFRYFEILQDGVFDFSVVRACYIMSIAVLLDQSAPEMVTSPSLALAAVNGNSRKIEFKPGESTYGRGCTTWWGIVDLGEAALDLIDSDEIDHYEDIYEEQVDEEGNTVKVVVDQKPVYKKVLNPDAVATGWLGDRKYDPAVGAEAISANDDEDGDGFVTIQAATVSETGMFSEIVTLNVSVGEIELNAPTLSLVGFNGLERIYTVGWTNNTLCGEEYALSFEADNGTVYGEDLNIGDQIVCSTNVKVTVTVVGYEDGVLEMDADEVGKDINRRAEETVYPLPHDWDFQNLTDEQKAIVMGEVIESYYLIVGEDSLVFTPEEYAQGQSADGVYDDLSDAQPNYAQTNWSWDSGNHRATLNVASDTLVEASLLHDLNSNGYGYYNDSAKIFDGLEISCPPNANNNSCIFMYIGHNNDLGAYFMSRPTITFPREVAAAGEYVLIYQGTGGSNYTNSRWASVYQVPVGELLSITLGNAVHVFYIDIYTYDGLPADDYAMAIDETPTTSKALQVITDYYSINGVKLASPQKGINIVKYADGTTMKVLMK